ncbi:hypothetical protein ES703_04913 [subsurface metagenome]
MAIEQVRGCGYRKVNALYIVGEYISAPCDRMPFPLTTCPVCGQGIKVSRGFTEVNPYRLWGIHQDCKDYVRPCFLCDPQDQPAYIMLVGAGNYKTPQDFLEEAHHMGISKRIPFIPKDLEIGKTVIYLAHPKACEVKEPAALQEAMAIVEEAQTKQPRLLETEKVEKALGIFCAFIPKKVEKLVWESELTDEKREQLEKRGITPVPIPDGDEDHA